MRSFRSKLNEEESHWASVPHDHLHAEIHEHMKAVQGKSLGQSDNPDYVSRTWKVTSPRPENEDGDGDIDANHTSNEHVHEKLLSLGFKRSPMHDVGEAEHPHMENDKRGFTSQAYVHPNGSMVYAHHGYDDWHDDQVWTNYELRTPKNAG